MSVANDYLELTAAVGEHLTVPPVQSIHVASPSDPGQSSKFGALVLTDNTVGLAYTALGDALTALQDHSLIESVVGQSPLEVARLYAGDQAWQRTLGMAAINAISQFLFRHCGYELSVGDETLSHLALCEGDHVGMVGYFPPLVEKVRALHLPLTVVELDERWLTRAEGFEVTLDPDRLARCNKIVCTGTVLLNQSIDDLSPRWRQAERVFVAGPTVGCLPDPLFERGVTLVGGCCVVDSAMFLQKWAAHEKWRGATRRYLLNRATYPGYRTLLAT